MAQWEAVVSNYPGFKQYTTSDFGAEVFVVQNKWHWFVFRHDNGHPIRKTEFIQRGSADTEEEAKQTAEKLIDRFTLSKPAMIGKPHLEIICMMRDGAKLYENNPAVGPGVCLVIPGTPPRAVNRKLVQELVDSRLLTDWVNTAYSESSYVRYTLSPLAWELVG
jgi:hypothetical protein